MEAIVVEEGNIICTVMFWRSWRKGGWKSSYSSLKYGERVVLPIDDRLAVWGNCIEFKCFTACCVIITEHGQVDLVIIF